MTGQQRGKECVTKLLPQRWATVIRAPWLLTVTVLALAGCPSPPMNTDAGDAGPDASADAAPDAAPDVASADAADDAMNDAMDDGAAGD